MDSADMFIPMLGPWRKSKVTQILLLLLYIAVLISEVTFNTQKCFFSYHYSILPLSVALSPNFVEMGNCKSSLFCLNSTGQTVATLVRIQKLSLMMNFTDNKEVNELVSKSTTSIETGYNVSLRECTTNISTSFQIQWRK